MKIYLAGLTAFAIGLSVCPRSFAQTKSSTNVGAYKDSLGKVHTWSISPAHSLVWDGSPYLPIGGVFVPRSLNAKPTEADWATDVEALSTLKAKGVIDIIVDPTVSAVDIPVSAWQRLIEQLDKDGFRYGITFGTGITTPLTGTVVKPTSYRMEEVRDGVELSWNVADADGGYYICVDGSDATQIQSEGAVRIRDGAATVLANTKASGTVAILYPHKIIRGTRDGTLPDVWSGFDRYRDRIFSLFHKVKFGDGLRFFLDPLTRRLAMTGETEYVFPDSPAFRLDWESYLTSHYTNIDDLMNAWGVGDRHITDFKMASRMIPLSASGRGVPFLLDMGTGKRNDYRGGDRIWSDLRDCRNESLIYYMNSVSDFLKREIANVPVIYTRTQQHRMFTNQLRSGGFDGLGMVAYGRGSAIVTSGADSVYSQAEESVKPIWCFVSETMDTTGPSKSSLGYATRESMFYDLDWLKKIGAKGIFTYALQAPPEDAFKNYQLLKAPIQIDWLKEYADRSGRGVVMDTRPNALPYPQEAAGIVHPGPIGKSGVWWMPSLTVGTVLNFGSSYAGYVLKSATGDMAVIWSLTGARKTHLIVPDAKKATVFTVDGLPIKAKIDEKKKSLEFVMDDTPVVVKNIDDTVLPLEAVEDAVVALRTLVSAAEEMKVLQPDDKFKYDNAADLLIHNNPKMALTITTNSLNKLVNLVLPYTWIEAERPEFHSLGEIVQNSAASGGGYINLNVQAGNGSARHSASYRFMVPADDTYTIWAAVSAGQAGNSPFSWNVDNSQLRSSTEGVTAGDPYLANQFHWINLGRAVLTRGVHSLGISITDVALGTNRYVFSADAFLVTRSVFHPNGTAQPPLLMDPNAKLSTDRESKDKKKKKTSNKP
ncbi:MAG: hypothetical protein ABJA67_05150 [Chthonomonadales bacterium]